MLLGLMAARYDDQRTSHHNPRNSHYYNNGNARPNSAKDAAAVYARGSFDKRKPEENSFRDKGNEVNKHRRDKTYYPNQCYRKKGWQGVDGSGSSGNISCGPNGTGIQDNVSSINDKTRLKEFGDWSEQTSSSGKRYFYNRQTEVSQWEKPADWAEYERGLSERNQRSPRSSGSSCHQRQLSTRPSTSTNAANSTAAAAEDGTSEKLSASRDSPNGRRHDDSVRHTHTQSQSRLLTTRGSDVRSKRDRDDHCSPSDDVAKRRRLEEPQTSNSADSCGAPHSQPSVGMINGNGGRPALDLSKLPDLVRVVAERLGIDMSEQRGLEQLQRSWNASKAVANNEQDSEATVLNASQPPPPLPPPITDVPQVSAMDDSPTCSAEVESREVEEEPLPASQQQRQVDEAPPIATLSMEHARFYRAAAGAHAAGWAAEHFEAQAWVHAASALELSLRLGDNSADLKCARSLVRTAEIRSTLLRQKLLFVSQQQRQLAASTRPPP